MTTFESYIRDKAESLSREELERLQLASLRQGVERLSSSVPFYREKLAGAKLNAESIRSIEDLARLPFTPVGRAGAPARP